MAPILRHISWFRMFILAMAPTMAPAAAGACGYPEVAVVSDTVSSVTVDDRSTLQPDTVAKRSFTDKIFSCMYDIPIVSNLLNYFESSNKSEPTTKLDVTFLGGPSYSESTSFQLAAVAAGMYKSDNDSLTMPSKVSFTVQGSVTGFYMLTFKGTHLAPRDKYRINYIVDFQHFPLYFWGMGYYSGRYDPNKSKYTLLQSRLNAEFEWRLAPGLFLGPGIYFDYSKASHPEKPELWAGEKLRTLSYGVEATIDYDTRDCISYPRKGVNVKFTARFFPKFIKNDYPFTLIEVKGNWYKSVWKGGLLATQVHGAFTWGDTPWSMLPRLDESGSIRSYYEGRYRDYNEMDAVAELRQHLWRRSSMVAWIGAGIVYDNIKDCSFKRILPSVGIGYRWELKKNTNLRVDFGVGKGSTSISMGMYESF